MAMRSRNLPPPYQVMRAHPPRSPGDGGKPTGFNIGGSSAGPTGSAPRQTLQSRLRQPLVLRLTPGSLALIGLFLALLLTLAYWIGHSQGWHAGMIEARQDGAGIVAGALIQGVSPHAPPPVVAPIAAGHANASPPAVEPRALGADAATSLRVDDPRQLGLNYFVLATTKREYAIPLLHFAIRWGVDAVAAKEHNGGLYQVVAPQGFRYEDRNSPPAQQYRQRLLELGQQWARSQPGQKDLSDLQLDPKPYGGERADDLITKANIP